jgi:hypothetical protein
MTIPAPGSHALPNVSAWPMSRLPTSEPLRLPRPPTTTTMSAGMRIDAPMGGWADWIGPATTPESAASAVPQTNTPVNTRRMSMPRPAAISASYTPARMMEPSRVRSMRSHSSTAMARPKTMTNIR